MRIVSLIASATEIVCALGFEDNLVGRSHECDYPTSILKLPSCSETKVNIHANSREIDRQVKEVVRKSLSVYIVNEEKLKNLRPDVIVAQDHCEVCAVSLKDVEKSVCKWLDAKAEIVSLRSNFLNDIWDSLRQVSKALQAPKRGEEVVTQLNSRMQAIQKKVLPAWPKPTVACIEWFDPLMAAGNWVPELVQMLGAKDLFGTPGQHAPWMTWEDLKSKDPDIIVTMPCGWDMKRSRQEIGSLTKNPVWRGLRAVKEGRVFVTDGNQFFNRPGPRVVESLEILAEILYPAHFSFGHRGPSWERL